MIVSLYYLCSNVAYISGGAYYLLPAKRYDSQDASRIDFEYTSRRSCCCKHEAYPEAEGSRPGYEPALSAQPGSNPGIKTWHRLCIPID